MAIAKELEKLGHKVDLPNGIINRAVERSDFDAVSAKADDGYDSMHAHFAKIRKSNALLVCNFTKKGIKNYIGANTFLEMGYAYSLGLPIYIYNPLPNMSYINDEIRAFNAISIRGDLKKIK